MEINSSNPIPEPHDDIASLNGDVTLPDDGSSKADKVGNPDANKQTKGQSNDGQVDTGNIATVDGITTGIPIIGKGLGTVVTVGGGETDSTPLMPGVGGIGAVGGEGATTETGHGQERDDLSNPTDGSVIGGGTTGDELWAEADRESGDTSNADRRAESGQLVGEEKNDDSGRTSEAERSESNGTHTKESSESKGEASDRKPS